MKARCMYQFLQILCVGKHCNRRTQYSLCSFPFIVSKMEESSTKRKISNNQGYLGLLPKKKLKLEPEEKKIMFRVLLLNGLNLTLQLEDAMENILVVEFVRTVRRKSKK